jgi:arsenate reductase (thioredoxin)
MLRWLEVFRRRDGRRRILFVCMGNSCRSPMAEAFARALGDDILIARSAGLLPSEAISNSTRRAMMEKNVPIRNRAPRLLSSYNLAEFDLVVNMTGRPLVFAKAGNVIDWDVADPAGRKLASHRAARDCIEVLVRNLLANLRFREGFAPRRDRAQSVGVGTMLRRILLLTVLIAGPLSSTPLYEEPADYAGLRTAGDLVALGASARNVWIRWNIEPAGDDGFLYRYDFGGLRPGRPWTFFLETEAPGSGRAGSLLLRGVARRRNSVSFYSNLPPVWGNFALSGGLFAVVVNEGCFHPDSGFAGDFIARPGDPESFETPESSMALPLLLLTVAAFFVHGTKRRLGLCS